ncbi:MAG: protein kinase [Kofleriaceae bacterium]|nr:protein kinase [Kofleriaceae bacterium]
MKVCPKCGKQYADDANFCTNDAGRLVAMSASVPAAAAAAGPTLLGGRFELREQVGSGATGAVHRATDTQTGAQVAVKLVAPAVVAQQAQRVERELKLLEKVQHAAVARVLGSGRQGDQVWVAMEWVDGAPLAHQVAAGGVEPERASELTLAIGAALVEAARVGVVHRDLSPDNVLVTAGGIKLINFALPLPGERVAGAPAFVSPEVIEGKPVDQRSSTYSLGALYYFLLTGQPPFSGEPHTVHAAHLSGSALPPSQRAAVAADVDSLVGRAMDRNPAKRYLTLKQFLDDIERVRRGPEGGTSSTAPFGRAGLGGSSAAGKRREPAATMLGVGALNEARTRQMDIGSARGPCARRRRSTPPSAARPRRGRAGHHRPHGSVAPPAETVSQAIAAHAASAAFVATEPVPAPPIAPVAPVVAPPVVAPPVVAAPPAAVAASASPWAPPAGPRRRRGR